MTAPDPSRALCAGLRDVCFWVKTRRRYVADICAGAKPRNACGLPWAAD